jgi:hypothetical protein
MPHELKVSILHKVRDIGSVASEIVVDAKDVMSLVQQPLAKMRAEKSGTSCHQNPLLQPTLLKKQQRLTPFRMTSRNNDIS